MSHQSHDALVVDFLAECLYDPLKHVMGSYPWEEEPSIGLVKLAPQYKDRFPGFVYGPDVWQCEMLDDIGRIARENSFNGRDAVSPIRMATVTGHGTGKSTLTAWLIKWILDTRPHSVGTVTATTAGQLREKTWSELGKWHAMSITREWFKYQKTHQIMQISHRDPAHAGTWKCTGVSCNPENSEAFAGQHSASGSSFYIFDEASGVPDIFYEVREGGIMRGEPMVFDFGNGTRKSGTFFEECQGRLQQRFIVRSVDSRECQLSNKAELEETIRVYGEDSDFVRVRIRGLFPKKASMQFYDPTATHEATERPFQPQRPDAPAIIGVDASGQGRDESVIWVRHGNDLRSFEPRRYSNIPAGDLAEEVIRYAHELDSVGIRLHYVYVDSSGGYGLDCVNHLTRNRVPAKGIEFGGKANDPQRYAYRVDELWGSLRDAIPDLLLPSRKLPHGESLYQQLTQREYGITLKGQQRLETKEVMKSRGLSSPDLADAAVLTFSEPVFMGATTHHGAGAFIFTPKAGLYQSQWR